VCQRADADISRHFSVIDGCTAADKFATIAAYFFLRLFKVTDNSMFEVNPVYNSIKDLTERTNVLRGYL
jgi:hypothetical protein